MGDGAWYHSKDEPDNYGIEDMALYYGAEDDFDTEEDVSLYTNKLPEHIQWRTKDNKLYYVKDMSTQHILNCIRALNNGTITSRYKQQWIDRFINEAIKRNK